LPTGNKILQQQTIDAINKLIANNKTDVKILQDKMDFLQSKLDRILTQLKLHTQYDQLITNEVIPEFDV